MPIGLVLARANRNDYKLLREMIKSLAVERSEPSADAEQGMCLGKGYDYIEVREIL